jgi:hypothetical protein
MFWDRVPPHAKIHKGAKESSIQREKGVEILAGHQIISCGSAP